MTLLEALWSPYGAGDCSDCHCDFPFPALQSSSSFHTLPKARAGKSSSASSSSAILLVILRRGWQCPKPMPPHHPIFGHVLLVANILGRLPRHAHAHYLADQIRRRYPELGAIFYLDTWPFGPPVLVVISPSLASQFTQDRVLPKHKGNASIPRAADRQA